MLVEISNSTKQKIDEQFVEGLVLKFCRAQKIKDKELSIAFVGDAAIRKLNREYRQKDQITDILSFEGEEEFLGELIIDYSQVMRQSKLYSDSPEMELAYILIHGLLHLLGYEDDSEEGASEMAKIGQGLMKKFYSVKIDLRV